MKALYNLIIAAYCKTGSVEKDIGRVIEEANASALKGGDLHE